MEKRGAEEADELETHQPLFKILDAVHRVSHDSQLSHNSLDSDSDSSAIKALLELRTASTSILSANPDQSSLSQHLSRLSELVQERRNSKPPSYGVVSFVTRRVRSHEVSRLASEIESELNALIDRETVSNLTNSVSKLRRSSELSDEDQLLDEMFVLQNRLSRGFDIDFQHLLLKSKVFAELEWVLCNPLFSNRVREKAAVSIKELVLFNKDVFVGSVLVGGIVKALVSMGCSCSLEILSTLIKAIKSPLVDEMESCGGISKIVGYLSCDDMETRVRAMNCIMEIGYYGRKEAVEAMINGGLIKKLVELQRLEMGFGKCVARFGVQLEVGEGLRQREKRAFKQQILHKVREACVCDAESATIVAEVLWGSSPY
ncbi:hypothetical protein BUALT_Bualt16G0074500 [Buddleja alternifolia]|uniref:Uncharacterized protein n=1 Tax=Buddleja alternifolia TaxID=168488 RepID=A0AAV6WAH9_9LAMI|nr:hypothetical protein BUALT_Bualt16G0074500 [Buddleja alternifolia]